MPATCGSDDVAPRIITVGGNREGDRFTEASAGKRWLVEHGVPAERVVAVGDRQRHAESVDAVEQRMQAPRLVDRGRGHRPVARAAHPGDGHRPGHRRGDVADPAGAGGAAARRPQIRYIARETVAYLYYKVFGGSSDHGSNAV